MVEAKATLPADMFYPNGFEGDLQLGGHALSLLSVRVVYVGRPVGGRVAAELAPLEQAEPVALPQLDASNFYLGQAVSPLYLGSDSLPRPQRTKEISLPEETMPKLSVYILQAGGLQHTRFFLGHSPYCVCQ